MYDLIIRGGTVVDGTGAPARTADVAVTDGRIVAVGAVDGQARRVADADGLVVTPGFVDIHTHYDGQATWDPVLAPSSWHGVTSVAMGNCGVGFAPAAPDRHDWLIGMMEGVEDIPGTALAEGLTWEWESFPEYLDALDRLPRSIDVGAHVPHAALRAYVMGERGADPGQAPTDDELERMTRLLTEAVAAGGLGLATSRTEFHRTVHGDNLGTLRAGSRELTALAGTLRGTGGVLQVISDAYQSRDDEFVRAELALLEAMVTTAGRPLSLSVQQPASAPGRWRELQDWAADCARRGLGVWTQVAPRPIGVLIGLTSSVNPFGRCPTVQGLAGPGHDERVRALREPGTREAVLREYVAFVEALPTAFPTITGFDRMYRLGDPVDYDLSHQTPIAPPGVSTAEGAALLYDALLEENGHRLLYLPLFNFVDGNLDTVRAMLASERALFGLSDAGAHCRAISDGSFTTTFLALWGRDRTDGLPLEQVVARITSATARHVGWRDRGELRPGLLADINVIDLDALGCAPPAIVADLPAGGSRLLQRAYGYRHTFKSGVETFADGEPTGELPGRLLRGARG
ncbi:MAG: D-aminoacylase [Frankia sp.]|nr:D-aminoacylase [Frankia sp.]